MPRLVLLPWLRLKNPVNIGKVFYTPYSLQMGDTKGVYKSFQNDINTMMSSYHDLHGNPISECALAYTSSRYPCSEKMNFRLVDRATTLLAFAAIENDYTNSFGDYSNNSYFDIKFQGFSVGKEWVSLGIRRRSGYSLDGGYKHSDLKVSVPIQCYQFQFPGLDERLLTSLRHVLAQKNDETRKMMQAISLFCQANTDSPFVFEEREVELLASAFERAIGFKGANDFAEKIEKLLKGYGSLKVGKCNRKSQLQFKQGYKEKEGRWYLFQKWAQEFYELRNHIIHGHDYNSRAWGWRIREHLMMASYLFPLITKILLNQLGFYEFTNDDIYHMHAIDILLDTDSFFQSPKGRSSQESVWNTTLRKYCAHQKIKEGLEKDTDAVLRSRKFQKAWSRVQNKSVC